MKINKFNIKEVVLSEEQVLLKKVFDGNDLSDAKITIVDSIMGSGKTTWAIEKMKSSEGKYIYITPYLDEVERVKSSLEGIRHLYDPTNKNNFGTKKFDFYKFVEKGLDVIATHSLFCACDIEILEHIKKHNYTLILDEVMEVVKIEKISKADFEMLLETGTINISDNGKVNWLDSNYNGIFDWVKHYAEGGQLYKHSSEDTNKVAFFVWQFPAEVFKYFKEVYIMTYLFDGQIQKYYFDMHEFNYDYKQVKLIDGKYTLVNYEKENEYKILSQLSKLINIYNGKLNNIGDSWNNFSSSYFKKSSNSKQIQQLKKNAENYYQHIVSGSAKYNIWTTFKGCESKLKGRGYSKGFTPINLRATNEYSHKNNLAYLCNRFLQPYEVSYFKDLGIEIDQDLWALSELVQWIWRSAIRNNEPINIYIPSSRMRTLLINWLDCNSNESIEAVA